MQRHASDLSDAFDIGARAPVHSWFILTFWSMLEIGISPPRGGEAEFDQNLQLVKFCLTPVALIVRGPAQF